MSKLGESSSSVVKNTPPQSNNVNAEHSLDDIADFADADPIHYESTKNGDSEMHWSYTQE